MSRFDSCSLFVTCTLSPDSGDEEDKGCKDKNDCSPPELRFNGSLNNSLFHGLPRLYATPNLPGSAEEQSATMARLSAAAMGAMGHAGWPSAIPPGFNPFSCLPFPHSSFPFFNPLTFHPLDHLSAMRPPSNSLSAGSSGSSAGSATTAATVGVNLSHKTLPKLDAQSHADSGSHDRRSDEEDGAGKRGCSQERD